MSDLPKYEEAMAQQPYNPDGAGPMPPTMHYQPQVINVRPDSNVVVSVVITFSEAPQRMVCTHCREEIVTRTTYETGLCTWISSGILCIFGCVPCCLIPFCVDATKDIQHHCPKCKNYLGTYRRVGS